MLIKIIAESPQGYNDEDLSINIPATGDLPPLTENEIPKDILPTAGTFTDYLGHTGQRINPHLVNSYHAVSIDTFHMIWDEERTEWVGITKRYAGFNSELDGVTETIYTSGPFTLDARCAELIRLAFKSALPLDKILTTPPTELEKKG